MKFIGPLATDSTDTDDLIKIDALWADPSETNGLGISFRGEGLLRYGPDLVSTFLNNNHYDYMIRSHEVPEDLHGFIWNKNKKCVTLFSASN